MNSETENNNKKRRGIWIDTNGTLCIYEGNCQ